KVPTTIASRCQQFSFRSVAFAEVVDRMAWICAQESIETDPEVLSVLAQAGEGSVRDSLSALDQAIACCGTKLKAEEVRGLLGMSSLDSLEPRLHLEIGLLRLVQAGKLVPIEEALAGLGGPAPKAASPSKTAPRPTAARPTEPRPLGSVPGPTTGARAWREELHSKLTE